MIEKLIALKIPPGIVKNGTMLQRAGRWADGNLVRFSAEDGSPRAPGGHAPLITTGGLPGGTPRTMFGWQAGSTGTFAVVGTTTKVASFDLATSPMRISDITPAGLTTPGTPDCYAFDVMPGGNLVFSPIIPVDYGNTAIYVWALNPASVATVASGSPAGRLGLVTPENFLVIFQDNAKIKWASQGTTNSWTPATTNSAGSLDVRTNGVLLAGRIAHGTSLLFTTVDLWELNYVGAPLYYGVRQVGRGCGLYAPNAVAVVENGTAYWMGRGGFFKYDGYVQPLRCDVADDIFPNLVEGRRRYTHAVVKAKYSEIWWHFNTDNSSTGTNKVAIYNYALDVWSIGSIDRAAVSDTGILRDPASILQNDQSVTFDKDGATVYADDDPTTVKTGVYIESGPFMLDEAGSDLVRVQKLVPDNNQTTSVEFATIFGGTWPKVAETSQVVQIPAAGGEPLDMRIQARYIRYKQELNRVDSRIGVPRIGIVKDAKR